MVGESRCVDIPRFADAPLVFEPFNHVIVPRFIRPDTLPAVMRDFPRLAERGSFPVAVTRFGPAFSEMLADIRSPELRQAIEQKFAIDLSHRPIMITVRGQASSGDGRIHTDTATKLVTMLIYVNAGWDQAGGRLRLLRSGADLEDYAVEVPPVDGTLVVFRPSDCSFHGHLPATGVRRVIQVNWMVDGLVKRREELRHTISFWSKSVRHSLRPKHHKDAA